VKGRAARWVGSVGGPRFESDYRRGWLRNGRGCRRKNKRSVEVDSLAAQAVDALCRGAVSGCGEYDIDR